MRDSERKWMSEPPKYVCSSAAICRRAGFTVPHHSSIGREERAESEVLVLTCCSQVVSTLVCASITPEKVPAQLMALMLLGGDCWVLRPTTNLRNTFLSLSVTTTRSNEQVD
jgi:hypothetical protein